MTEGAVAMTQLSAAQAGKNSSSDGSKTLYGGKGTRRITVRDIALAKERGEKWPMLTAYDAMTASVFDEAGIPVMLVGDSAGNCHLGYESTVPVTLDEMAMLSAAVVRGTSRALIVADLLRVLPGGSGAGAALGDPAGEGGRGGCREAGGR